VLVTALLAGVTADRAGWVGRGGGGDRRGVVVPDDLRSRLFFIAEPEATEVVRADHVGVRTGVGPPVAMPLPATYAFATL
jgi:hypothetical protein